MEIMYCEICKKPVDLQKMRANNRSRARKKGYAYCSKECSKKGAVVHNIWTPERRKKASEQMKEQNKTEAFIKQRQSMKINNPMNRPEIREKVSKTLKERGHRPPVRGGNGTGLTEPQKMLMDALTELEIFPEYVVPTKKSKEGYPTCYKIDLARPAHMLAIEIDGNSHCSLKRQEQDKKKADFLSGLGWKVLRLKNKQVMEHLEDCVQMVKSTILE